MTMDAAAQWPKKLVLLADAASLARLLLERKVPPLDREDVIPMVGIDIAAHRLVPTLAPEDRVSSMELVHCEVVCVSLAAEANTILAAKTGFVPSLWVPTALSRDALLDHVGARLADWRREVLTPAIEGDHHGPRSDALRHWSARLFDDTFPFPLDIPTTVDRLEDAYRLSPGPPVTEPEQNLNGFLWGGGGADEGGDDNDEVVKKEDRFKRRRRGARGTLELLRDHGTPFEDFWKVDQGRLVPDEKTARKRLTSIMGRDKRIRPGGGDVRLSPDPLGLIDEAQGPPLHGGIEALRTLRALRDARPLPPLLDRLVDATEALVTLENPEAEAGVAYTVRAIDLVRSQEEPTRGAALTYEVLGGAAGEKTSRREVADAYGVTPRAIETHGPWARDQLDRLWRLAAG